jgi:AcrR family transcriptional regulator
MSASSTRAEIEVAGRAAQKADTRRRILDTAKRLCARRGFAATRTLDVARHAKVSHGSVFVHFPSREDLIGAVIGELARDITDAVYARVHGAGGALRDGLRAHLDALAEHEEAIRWLLLETPLLPGGFHLAWVGLQSAISVHLAEAAARDIAAGRVRAMPAHLLFNTWIGLIHHYVINRELFAPGRSVLRAHGDELLDHFMGLIEAPRGRRR